jgi:hypothetical protein
VFTFIVEAFILSLPYLQQDRCKTRVSVYVWRQYNSVVYSVICGRHVPTFWQCRLLRTMIQSVRIHCVARRRRTLQEKLQYILLLGCIYPWFCRQFYPINIAMNAEKMRTINMSYLFSHEKIIEKRFTVNFPLYKFKCEELQFSALMWEKKDFMMT